MMSQFDGQRRWENRPIEREQDRLRTRSLRGVVLGLVFAFAPAGAYLLQQNECLELTYAIDALHREQDELAEHERRLMLKQSDLEALDEIERWASREQGLSRPDAESVIVLDTTSPAPGHLVADGR